MGCIHLFATWLFRRLFLLLAACLFDLRINLGPPHHEKMGPRHSAGEDATVVIAGRCEARTRDYVTVCNFVLAYVSLSMNK
jgi:hypothetical protein